ncbi:MAG: GNAT family N-acetyltransferase [Planctomycetota bacterium]|nr:MAG: GNAT family N-acetyltransferase [Planctomycetota bacterium]
MTDLATIPAPLERPVTSPSMLKLRVMDAKDRVAALTIWRGLEQRVALPPLAASEAWTRVWLDHYGETVRFWFIVAEDEGQVRGICLYTESAERKAPLLSLHTHHLGTAGDPVQESACVEYNSLLVEPAWRVAFQDAISHWLLTQSAGDVIQLDGFTAEETRELTAHWPAVEIRNRDSKYLDLEVVRSSGKDLIDHLGRSTRANLRRKLRDYGDIETEWATTLSQAEDIFAELIDLHQARWQAIGERGAFGSSRFRNFQRTLLSELFPTHRCVVFRARHQGSTVGALLLLVDRNRLLDYLSGLAAFDQKPSPGLVTHYLCQCAALQRGFSAYDFLVGDKRHKENLSTHTQTLTWTRLHRPTVKSRIVAALTQLKRRMRPLPSGGSTVSSNTSETLSAEPE